MDNQTAKKIEAYFAVEKMKAIGVSKYHTDMAKTATFPIEKKHHEDMAWKYGVSKIAMLNDICKDLMKL